MKNLFPEYSELPAQEYKDAWSKGLFVFDTSVLLNLYRYRAETRDELLNVLSKLKRIWIPFHVAHEFHRNRVNVIAAQNNLFSKVRQAVEASRDNLSNKMSELQNGQRHALIDPEPLISGFNKLAEQFLLELEELRKKQQQIIGGDPIRDRVYTVFEGRIGAPPKDQKELDEIYKRAETRFKQRIPPGYEDEDKDKGSPDEHFHAGMVYKRKFGDYLIWSEILDHAKNNSVKAVIFVTDDAKDDWWWKVNCDGPKVLGARPELIEEARSFASIERFFMYKSEGFLKYAGEHLKASVSAEMLKEVRDVSKSRSSGNPAEHNQVLNPIRARNAVKRWLQPQFEKVLRTGGFPDLVAFEGGRRQGFEVKTVRFFANAPHRLSMMFEQYRTSPIVSKFAAMTFVIVTGRRSDALRIERVLHEELREIPEGRLRILIGVLNASEAGVDEFEPSYDIPY